MGANKKKKNREMSSILPHIENSNSTCRLKIKNANINSTEISTNLWKLLFELLIPVSMT